MSATESGAGEREGHRTFTFGQSSADGDACRDCSWEGPVGSGPQHERDAATPDADDASEHDFLPVAGHPDDDECTHRADGTDATYCGRTRAEHEHHPKCYQRTGVPDDLPADLCDCRVLRTIEAASADASGALSEACPCGCPRDMHIDQIGCPCGLPDEPPCAAGEINRPPAWTIPADLCGGPVSEWIEVLRLDHLAPFIAARESAATRARAEGAAEMSDAVRLLLAKYEGRSKWVGYEQPRREAWSEIENDLRALLRDRAARIGGDA